MSNVLARNRKLTKYDFYNTAIDIRTELTKFCMNEKNIPKRWRFIHAIPIIESANELVELVVASHVIYPSTVATAEKRKELQLDAIATVEVLYQKLQFALEILEFDLNKLNDVVDKIELEIKLLKGCRDATTKTIKQLKLKEEENKENSKKLKEDKENSKEE